MDRKEYMKQYNLNRRLKTKEYNKQYRIDNPNLKRKPVSHIIRCSNRWKERGVIDHFNDNYKTLYRIYQSTKFCDRCNIILNKETRKCLDHCHTSGYFRNILCNSCNCKTR